MPRVRHRRGRPEGLDYTAVTGVDWPRVIADLHRVGPRSAEALAKRVRVASSSLKVYRQEDSTAEPSHRAGERIVAAWLAATGQARERLPVRSVVVRGRR